MPSSIQPAISTQLLKTEKELQQIPVIMLSAYHKASSPGNHIYRDNHENPRSIKPENFHI